MAKKFIIGNWKCNKNEKETADWFLKFSDLSKNKSGNYQEKLTVIVCPPYLYLKQAYELLKEYKLNIKLGVQDISPYGPGAYTGEIASSQAKEYADFAIIGHSERRNYFMEDDELLKRKMISAGESGLETIYCVPDEKTSIPVGVRIAAYEPIWAIGTGKSDTPKNANAVCQKIKEKFPLDGVIYGGSVSPENISGFLSQNNILGVLPGNASLDPLKFWQMIENASKI